MSEVNERRGFLIENSDDWLIGGIECPMCGKVGKKRKTFWLPYLCQHFIALCPGCFEFFAEKVKRIEKE